MRGNNKVIHPTLDKLEQINHLKTETISLISASIVKEGGKVLAQISPQSLLPEEDDTSRWFKDNYACRREVYIAVAKHGEALLAIAP